MNVQALLKQAQKMQSEIVKAEKALAEKEYVEENDLMIVKCNGKYQVTSIEFKENATEDVEMLQDLLTVTINKVIDAAKQEHDQMMNKLTGGVKMPGGF